MINLELSDSSNDYMLGERTQIKFVFTVKGEEYAKALVNTIYHAKFESYNNFIIYAFDDIAKSVLKRYNIPYKDSYGVDVYNDKVLNLIESSIDNPNTLIVALDTITTFDFHVVRGCLGRLSYRNNTIYYPNYFDILGFNYNNNRVMCNILLAYNLKDYNIDKYLKCLKRTKKCLDYPLCDSTRYMKETTITEETVLTKNKYRLPLKHLNRQIVNKIKYAILFCDGGKTLNKMFEEHLTDYKCYRIEKEFFI